MSDKGVAEELNKLIIRKFQKPKVYSSITDNIWGAYLVNMQLTSKFNRGILSLLCVIDVFSKHAWVNPLKDEKCTTTTNALKKS